MLPEFGEVTGHVSLAPSAGDMLLVRGTLSIGRLTVLATRVAKMSGPTLSEFLNHVVKSGADRDGCLFVVDKGQDRSGRCKVGVAKFSSLGIARQ